MPFLFVDPQNRLYLLVQNGVLHFQTPCQILMHRGFADAESLGGGADGGSGVRHEFSDLLCPGGHVAITVGMIHGKMDSFLVINM
jgi:hypothetical protein